MKHFFYILILLITSCNSPKSNKIDTDKFNISMITTCFLEIDTLELGKKISDDNNLQSECSLLISSSQFAKSYNIQKNNIKYEIAVDKENRIIYISTKDKSFITPDSVKIGMQSSDVSILSEQTPYLMRGWAYVIPLNSGWNAAFEISNYETNSIIPTVKWIYKRSK